MSNECYPERVIYYWRHGLYGHVRRICEIGLESKSTNLFLWLYHSLSLAIVGQTQKSLE